MEDIAWLLLVSHALGINRSCVQASGGNTSLKIQQFILIKASGKKLRDCLEENIFILIKKEDFNENIGWFHCDAVQAFGKVPIDFNNMPFDSISLSSHKIHGPKGIGALVVKDPSKLPGFILGGMQENSMRAGTESIANIVGFASAAQKIDSMLEKPKSSFRKDAKSFKKMCGYSSKSWLLEMSTKSSFWKDARHS